MKITKDDMVRALLAFPITLSVPWMLAGDIPIFGRLLAIASFASCWFVAWWFAS